MIFKVKSSHILCIFGIFFFVSPSYEIGSTVENKQFINDLGTFSNRLFSELSKANPGENILSATFSIHLCLAMLRMGAKNKTADEMDQGLALSTKYPRHLANNYHAVLKEYQDHQIFKIANKVYITEGSVVRIPFYEFVTEQFFSSVAFLNFTRNESAAKVINSWVQDKTDNAIKDLISPSSLGANTRLVLVNAIHFQGEWVNAFNESDTREMDFFLNETNSFKVQMMTTRAQFNYFKIPKLNATALEMPYRNSDLAMLIILPDSRTGLPALEDELKTYPLSDITYFMDAEDVVVNMPKFTAEFQSELSVPLTNMGMGRMFSDEAEFDDILVHSRGLHVSSVNHKTFIEVNEKGTKAGGATSIGGSDRIYKPKHNYTFTVDRPFFYIIKSEMDMELFKGCIKTKF